MTKKNMVGWRGGWALLLNEIIMENLVTELNYDRVQRSQKVNPNLFGLKWQKSNSRSLRKREFIGSHNLEVQQLLVLGRSPSGDSDDIILPLSLLPSHGSASPSLALFIRTIPFEGEGKMAQTHVLSVEQHPGDSSSSGKFKGGLLDSLAWVVVHL